MKTDKARNTSAEGELKFTGIRIKEPAQTAAGLTGVKVAMEHAMKEMGLLKGVSTLLHMNQKEGFDCPGCAWPDPEKRSKIAEYCENGAKALAEEATNKRVDPEFFKRYSVEELSQWSDYEIGKSGRLTHPMVLREGRSHYEPISWEGAFDLIGKHIQSLPGPDEAVFYTSGRSSNEAAFLYGLFARALGTNNLPDCSNMCHESSGVALSETLGIGKGSVKLEDLHEAEVIMVIGQNPGTNHPRMLMALEKCKHNGGKIISVNPLAEAGLSRFKNPQTPRGILSDGTLIADLHLPVKINQDVPLIKLIIKKLATLDRKHQDIFDHDFIKKYVSGYVPLMQDLEQYNDQDLLTRCGVDETLVDRAVELLAKKQKIIICWAMGLTQHKNGVENIKECVNLLLLKGSLGKPGAGTCPVRGHSNVQGDRSVGIMHYVSKPMNAAIKKVFGFDPPEHHGLDVVHAIEAMHKEKAKVFVALGGNFVSAASDTRYTAEALQKCNLTVQISTKLNRSHLITGKTALILPTLGRSERDLKDGEQRFLTVENSMGKVHRTKGLLPPASGNLKSEPEIVTGIAHAVLGNDHPIDWKAMGSDYELTREKMGAVLRGFENLSKRSEGSGYYLPNNVRELDFSKFPDGKAKLSVCKLPEHGLEEDEFLLMTIRSHDQFNTTIYGLDDRYRGIYNERRVVFMNPEDMKQRQLRSQEVIDMTSTYDGVVRRAEKFMVIPYEIPRGNLASYFPETNVLVPYNHFADKSHTPISKSVKVRILKTTSHAGE
ncbi:FdhF/YdeP family oxidoreductase [Robertkochia sediminum]|uniref:FdhF/YdeP family oxidoreductase n=1 Tax=Robertkochia sediminum TaxID=2785326 RepID=UPI0019342AFD|nr:FdhF/YdeP family oxidoreductase [Robertkochia sediminum]MBL7473861.1 FdhF/YdeP family oxidoreductase [Robertkochia sediminum]